MCENGTKRDRINRYYIKEGLHVTYCNRIERESSEEETKSSTYIIVFTRRH